MLRRLRILVFLAAFMALCLPARAVQAKELIVSGAASLTNAFTEMKEAFEKANPGVTIVTNFAASGPLLKQIETGAPADVFASADQATMDKAQAQNLIDVKSRVNFAANSLVLIVPAGEKSSPKKVEDLKGAAYPRIAIGNPDSVPAGRYAREVLQERKLWDALQSKFIMAESVRQALDYVSRAEVNAGFVYGTDAKQAGDKVSVVQTLTGKTPVLYPIAVISASKNKKEAQAFVDFAKSKQGQAILAKYGFSAP